MSCKSKTTFTPPLILEILELKGSCSLIDQEYFMNDSRNRSLREIEFSRNRQEHQILLSETEETHFKNES